MKLWIDKTGQVTSVYSNHQEYAKSFASMDDGVQAVAALLDRGWILVRKEAGLPVEVVAGEHATDLALRALSESVLSLHRQARLTMGNKSMLVPTHDFLTEMATLRKGKGEQVSAFQRIGIQGIGI